MHHIYLKIATCFILISVHLPAQNKVIVKKHAESDCCKNLILQTFSIPKNDTIGYDKLIQASTISFGISFIGCESNVNSVIHSMELRVNNNKNKVFIKGNIIDFRNYLELKKGGIIIIENIKASCTNQYNELNEVIIKSKIYNILPSEE